MAEAADGPDAGYGSSADRFDHGANLTLHVTRCTFHHGADNEEGRRFAPALVQHVTWNV